MPDSVRWYATLLAITVAFAPLARLAGTRLPARGAFIARPLGVLLTVWPLWLLASLSPLPFDAAGLWITVAIAGVAGWAYLVRRGEIDRSWLRSLLVAELLGLAVFAGMCWLRGFTPQIAGTEKPMDIAFLSSSARSTDMPPADPWMAGESINYYYLGYLLNGSLARMSGVATAVGFNLALATTASMAIVAAAGAGFDVLRGRFSRTVALIAAGLAPFFVVVAGNMLTPRRLLADPSGTWHAWWWQGVGWNASRIVVDRGTQQPGTINEFPSFSFILGDLHPHVMALPFTIVALGLALALLRIPRGGRGETSVLANDDDVYDAEMPALETQPAQVPAWFTWAMRWPGHDWLLLATTAIVVGALYPLNSWDFPTYLAIALLALLAVFRLNREFLIWACALVAIAVLAWIPFTVTFVPFAGGDISQLPATIQRLPVAAKLLTSVALYDGERTSVAEFLTVFGMPWLILVLTIGVLAYRARSELALGEAMRWPVAAAVVVALLAVLLPAPVLILAGAPLAVSASLLLARRDVADLSEIALLGLSSVGSALILGAEFFYIQDVFHGRFNTLFKVYYQVWTLLGIAAAIAIALAWEWCHHSAALRRTLAVGIVLAVTAGLSYPVVSARSWTTWQGPREWRGLDGSAYLAGLSPGDLAAIEWLVANAKPGDVILEAPGCSYQVNGGEPTSRFSAFSGVPTVIGWGGHESQWRGGQAGLLLDIGLRQRGVATMYGNPGSKLFERYDVTLIAAGSFEHDGAGAACDIAGPFPSVDSASFPGPGWSVVFTQDDTTIWRRDGTG